MDPNANLQATARLPHPQEIRHMTTEQRFNDLQTKWRGAAQAESDYRITLAVRYGNGNIQWAKAAERKRLETLSRAERRAFDRFFAHLSSFSPRDWSSMVPVSWMREKLTYADAVTRGALSTVPEPAWGYTTGQMWDFAREIPAA